MNLNNDKIKKAAERIVAQHFFAGIDSDDYVSMVWEACDNMHNFYDNNTLSDNGILVWEPFENYNSEYLSECMISLRDSIIDNMEAVACE